MENPIQHENKQHPAGPRRCPFDQISKTTMVRTYKTHGRFLDARESIKFQGLQHEEKRKAKDEMDGQCHAGWGYKVKCRTLLRSIVEGANPHHLVRIL